jgi:hypothetical protein
MTKMTKTKSMLNHARRCTAHRRLLAAFDIVATDNNNALIEPVALFAPDLAETTTDAVDDATYRMQRRCYNLDTESRRHDVTLAELLAECDATPATVIPRRSPAQPDAYTTPRRSPAQPDAYTTPRCSPAQPDAYTTPRRSPAQPDEPWTYNTPQNSPVQPDEQWTYNTPQRRPWSSPSTTPTAPFYSPF